MRWMVATTMAREDNMYVDEESLLVIFYIKEGALWCSGKGCRECFMGHVTVWWRICVSLLGRELFITALSVLCCACSMSIAMFSVSA